MSRAITLSFDTGAPWDENPYGDAAAPVEDTGDFTQVLSSLFSGGGSGGAGIGGSLGATARKPAARPPQQKRLTKHEQRILAEGEAQTRKTGNPAFAEEAKLRVYRPAEHKRRRAAGTLPSQQAKPPNPRRPRSGSSSPNRPPAAPRRHPARGRELPRLRRRTYGDGQQDDNPRALCHVRHVPLLNARCTRGHGRCKFVRGGRCGASTGSSRGGTSAAVGARDRDDREGPPHGDGVDENFPPGCRRRRTILERVFWPRANEAAACVARRDARRVRPRGPV